MIRVTSKPYLGFWPKRWEEREVPVPKPLIELLQIHPRGKATAGSSFSEGESRTEYAASMQNDRKTGRAR
jgi:hypothetical protein